MALWLPLDRAVGSVPGLSLLETLETRPEFAWASSEVAAVCGSGSAALGWRLQEGWGCGGPGAWGGLGRSWFLGPELWGEKQQVSGAGTQPRLLCRLCLPAGSGGRAVVGERRAVLPGEAEDGVCVVVGGRLTEE